MDNPTVVHLTAQETALRQKLFALQQVKKILLFAVRPKELRLRFVWDSFKQYNTEVKGNFRPNVMFPKEVSKNDPYVLSSTSKPSGL